jgi:hypothetical protein
MQQRRRLFHLRKETAAPAPAPTTPSAATVHVVGSGRRRAKPRAPPITLALTLTLAAPIGRPPPRHIDRVQVRRRAGQRTHQSGLLSACHARRCTTTTTTTAAASSAGAVELSELIGDLRQWTGRCAAGSSSGSSSGSGDGACSRRAGSRCLLHGRRDAHALERVQSGGDLIVCGHTHTHTHTTDRRASLTDGHTAQRESEPLAVYLA